MATSFAQGLKKQRDFLDEVVVLPLPVVNVIHASAEDDLSDGRLNSRHGFLHGQGGPCKRGGSGQAYGPAFLSPKGSPL